MLNVEGLQIKKRGIEDYQATFSNMQEFVLKHESGQDSEIWFVQHPAVYTQGTACTAQTLAPSDIPVVKSDRGGQITYHGPGQVIMYVLLDIKRYGLTVKSLVSMLEQCSIMTLAEYGIQGIRREGAPGVYADDKKISALGLRFKRGISYHGLSLNVDMDLRPFANIDPCGYKDLEVTQISDFLTGDQSIVKTEEVEDSLFKNFQQLILRGFPG